METKDKKGSTKELIKNIQKLDHSIETGNKFTRSFFLGIARGVGVAIGATVIAGALFFGGQKFINVVEDAPLLNKFFNRE